MVERAKMESANSNVNVYLDMKEQRVKKVRVAHITSLPIYLHSFLEK